MYFVLVVFELILVILQYLLHYTFHVKQEYMILYLNLRIISFFSTSNGWGCEFLTQPDISFIANQAHIRRKKSRLVGPKTLMQRENIWLAARQFAMCG